MRRYRLAALLVVLLIPLPLEAAAQPSIYVKTYTGVFRGARITLVKAVPPSSILLYLNNGTLIYENLETGARYTRSFKGAAVSLTVRGGTAYIVLENGGVYKLSLPKLDVTGIFSLIQGGDEVGVSLAAVSGDGRYVAASLQIRYQDILVNRLIVYDTAARRRVFLRDPYSSEKLFKVFSVDFSGNYLVVEDLDTLCELCELTDNYIEVYTVSPRGVERVAAYRTGLTLKYVGGGYVLAQRIQRDGMTGLYETYLFLLPDLKVLGKAELEQAKNLFMLMDTPYVLVKDRRGGFRLLRLAKNLRPASSVKLPLRVNVGFLGGYLVAYTLTNVYVYEPHYFRQVYSYPVNVPAPDFLPSTVDSEGTVSVARYGPRMYVAVTLVQRVSLEVKVVSSGSPVEGASIVLKDAKGNIVAHKKTGADGTARFEVRPGEYRIEVSKEGFTQPPPVTLLVDGDKKITVQLSRKTVKTFRLTVVVLGPGGKPLPKALVKVESEGVEYSAVTGREGSAVFQVPKGKYIVTASAPGLVAAKSTVTLEKDLTLRLILRKPSYTIRVEVSAGDIETKSPKAIAKVKVIDANGTLIGLAAPGSPLIKEVDRGLYRVTPVNPACTARPSMFLVNANSTIRVTLTCKARRAPLSLLSQVTSFLANETLRHNMLNLTLSLPTVEAPNGTPVSLDSLARGKVLVIEFFYTKCTGCRYLLPALKKLASTDKVQVVSLTVSPADTEVVIEAYRREHGISWPILRDTAGLYQRLNITNYPTVAVYYSGRIVFIGVGSSREVEELARKPEAVLHIVSMAREVLGDDMYRLPEILILAGLVVFLASASRGERVAEQEDEGEDKSVLFHTDSSDIYSIDSRYGGGLDEALPLDSGGEEEYW